MAALKHSAVSFGLPYMPPLDAGSSIGPIPLHNAIDTLDKMLAPDFISHTNRLAGQPPDREGYKRQVANSVSAFSDVRFVIEEQIAKGEKVVSRISGRGTHDRSELLDSAPTGREQGDSLHGHLHPPHI